jgi:hypothetical protein
LGGVISPVLTGVVVGWTGSYYLAFAVASGMLLVGAASYLILVGEIGPLEWTKPSPEGKIAVWT